MKLLENRLAIMIALGFQPSDSDDIVVIDHGIIVEEGTHSEFFVGSLG